MDFSHDEVHFSSFLICLHQSDADGHAHGVGLAGEAALQGHGVLLVNVFVIVHRAHMDKAFHPIVKAHEDAEASDAGHVSVERLAHEGHHVLGHLEIHHIALCFCGVLLGLRAMVRRAQEEFRLFLQLRFIEPIGKGLTDQAMHHEIRVAADRRSEMGIALTGDAEVAFVLRAVASLRKTAKRHDLHHRLDVFALHRFQKLLHILWLRILGDGNPGAHDGHEPLQGIQFLFIRMLVHAVNGGVTRLFQETSHRFIGRNHGIFDHFFRVASDSLLDAKRHAGLIEDDFIFREIKVQCAAAGAIISERIGALLQVLQHRKEWFQILRRDAFMESLIDFRIIAAPRHADNGRRDDFRLHLALRRHIHDAGHGVAVFVVVQAAKIIGQLEWKHGDHSVRQIHTGAAMVCLIVQRCASGHIAGHVSDVDPQLKVTILFFHTIHRIIQIFGVRAVDGDDGQVAEILDPLLRRDGARQIVRLLHHIFGKFVRQPMLRHDDVDVETLVAFVAQDLGDPTFCIGPLAGPLGDLHHHPRTGDSAHFFARWDLDVHIHLLIDGYRLAAIGKHFVGAHEAIVRTLQDLQHPALHLVAAGLALHGLHLHRVVIHRIQVISIGNIDILVIFVSDEETEAPIGLVHALQDRPRLVRQKFFLFFHCILLYICLLPLHCNRCVLTCFLIAMSYELGACKLAPRDNNATGARFTQCLRCRT